MAILLAGCTAVVALTIDSVVRRRSSPGSMTLIVFHGVLAGLFLLLSLRPQMLGVTAEEPWTAMLAGGFIAMGLNAVRERLWAPRADRAVDRATSPQGHGDVGSSDR
ncbi:hypothetical protein [Actinotalea sp. C106]|uniref:hypothetical protein n=1 Tax=Actinotalea sp. C106 TaxID=2908644 RepID=UPI0020290DD7|nr:hypothetical protein [Actinotalea sp. C106]